MSIETDSPIVYHGTGEARFPRNEAQAQPAIPQLTPEDREILRQCNKESLYFRCLPFAFAGMATVFYAAKRGIITPHPLWGPAIPMTGAAFMGWLVGKLSYKTKCEDKFVNVQNSFIGESIRKKRGIMLERYQSDFDRTQYSGEDMTLRDSSSFSAYSDSSYHPSTGSLNLDVDKNIQYSGLDDRERPSTDRETFAYQGNETDSVKKFTTHEELRLRNREDYERAQRSYSSRLEVSSSSGSKPWSNVDNTPPRRYASDLGDSGDVRRKDGDNWDNTQVF